MATPVSEAVQSKRSEDILGQKVCVCVLAKLMGQPAELTTVNRA